MSKKIAMFVILIISVICLAGCANVNYTRVYSVDGVIIDDITFTLNKDIFDTTAKANAVIEAVKSDVQALDLAIDNWVKQNFAGKYVGTDSMEEYFADGYSVVLAPKVEEDDEGYIYYFSIKYKTLQHFIYFYGLNTADIIETYGLYNIEDVEPFMAKDFGPFISQILIGNYNIDDPNLFIKDLVWTKDNVYKYFTDMEKSNGDKYLDYYIDIANNALGQEYNEDTILNNVVIKEMYQTTEDRYDSDGNMYRDGSGYIIHQWEIEDVTDKISFMRHRPNQVWWYVSAVVISICGAVILLFLHRKKGEEK